MKTSLGLLALTLVPGCGGAAPPPAAPPSAAASVSGAPGAPVQPPPTTPPPPAAPLSPGVVLVGDIIAPPKFDPKEALENLKPELLRCYNETRSLTPTLRGKLVLKIKVNEAGAVTGTDAQPGGSANDPGLVACISDAVKPATFPKPGGMATITVPLIFKP
jgi:hypothetical protein